MKTSGVTTALIVLLFVLVGWLFYLSSTQTSTLQETGLSGVNKPLGIDRVKNAQERTRMQAYVEKLQSEKKVIKSFQGPSGETIDCVDIFSQPALSRPGMEKHELQFAPASQPAQSKAEDEGQQSQDTDQTPNQLYLLTGETCPEETAPMRRLTMETLMRFETLDDFFKKRFINIEKPFGGNGSSTSTHEYAHAARTVNNWGAESIINLWKPFVDETDEFSLSQIWVVRGSGSNLETVEAGWQKYYDLYGDWRSRLFIYFTPDNYGNGGCYNLSCGAFVQTNNSVYISGGFTHYSSAGGSQYAFKLMLLKDHTNGHWWLKYGDTWVGYWPRNLFDSNGLRDRGDRIDFGGEIVNTSPGGAHTHTDMGSGYWPYQGYGYAAYQHSLRYVDTNYTYQKATGLNASRTDRDCYDIDLRSSSGSWGEYFYFGGSGHNSNCP
jgi:hypothetical protein